MKEISYLELARHARATGNERFFWVCFRNHARAMKKTLNKSAQR